MGVVIIFCATFKFRTFNDLVEKQNIYFCFNTNHSRIFFPTIKKILFKSYNLIRNFQFKLKLIYVVIYLISYAFHFKLWLLFKPFVIHYCMYKRVILSFDLLNCWTKASHRWDSNIIHKFPFSLYCKHDGRQQLKCKQKYSIDTFTFKM